MNCHTCRTRITLARRVAILDLVVDDEQNLPSPYRTAFVCQTCYSHLDTTDRIGSVDGRMYMLAGPSRFGKAPLYTAEMFDDYQRCEALKLTADAS
jgi:hypothetical protein